MKFNDIDIIIQYIVTKGNEVVNIYDLAEILNKNERSIREALYQMNERGYIILDRADGYRIVCSSKNFDRYHEEIIEKVKEQKARAMTSIVRYNRMIKALPNENQGQFMEIME